MKRIMIVTILIFFQSCLHRDIKNNITELLNKKIIIPENLESSIILRNLVRIVH